MSDELTPVLAIAVCIMIIECAICHSAKRPMTKFVLPILILPIFFFAIIFAIGGSDGSFLDISSYLATLFFTSGIIWTVALILGWILSGVISVVTTSEGTYDSQKVKAFIKRGSIGFFKILYPLGIGSFMFFYAYLFSMRSYAISPLFINLSQLSVADYPFAWLILADPLVRAPLFLFWICLLLFLLTMFIRAFSEYNFITWLGFAVLLLAGIISYFAYLIMPRAFPNEQSYQYASYNVITLGLTIMILASFYLIAIGYFKKEEMFSLGVLSFVAAIFTTIFVGMYAFELMMHNQFSAAGNLAIYVPMIYIFCLSFAYTFRMKKCKIE